MRVGFTGTREGLTIRQGWKLQDWFFYPRDGGEPRVPIELHHGCCVGADGEFVTHMMRARVGGTDDRMYAAFHAHPSDMPGMTDEGALALSDAQYCPKPPLDRNHDIVDACDVLFACPKGPEEQRSGTWATVRFARRQGKSIVIFWPDGTVTEEGGNANGSR